MSKTIIANEQQVIRLEQPHLQALTGGRSDFMSTICVKGGARYGNSKMASLGRIQGNGAAVG